MARWAKFLLAALAALAVLATTVAGDVRNYTYPNGNLQVVNVTGTSRNATSIKCVDHGTWVDCQFFGLPPNTYVKDYNVTCRKIIGPPRRDPPPCRIAYEVGVKPDVRFVRDGGSVWFDGEETIAAIFLMSLFFAIFVMSCWGFATAAFSVLEVLCRVTPAAVRVIRTALLRHNASRIQSRAPAEPIHVPTPTPTPTPVVPEYATSVPREAERRPLRPRRILKEFQ